MQPAGSFRSTRFGAQALLVLALCGLATQAQAVQYRVSAPADVNRILPIEAGGSASLVIEVENIDAQAGVASVSALMRESGPTINGYTLGAGQPAQCGAPTSTTTADGKLLSFPVSLAALQTLRCSYPINRDLSSRDDLSLGFCMAGFVNCFDPAYRAGTLPDMRISSDIVSVPYGSTDAIVRITQHNPSSRAVATRLATTACITYIGPRPDPFGPFNIEADFPGACPALTTNICGTGFPSLSGSAWQFTMPSTPANGDASCLLRLRFHAPLTASAISNLISGPPPVPFVDGGSGFDLWSLNNMTAFGAVPVAAPVPATGWASLFGLTALFGALAMTALRRRFGTQSVVKHAD